MISSQKRNPVHQDINTNPQQSVYQLDQSEFCEPIEQIPMNSQQQNPISNIPNHYKAYQFDQDNNNITIDEILSKQKLFLYDNFKSIQISNREEDFGSYEINIEGVNKRRALFGLDVNSTKNNFFEGSDLSNHIGIESPPIINETKKIKQSYEDNTKSTNDFIDKSSGQVRQQIELQKQTTQSPIQSLKILSPKLGIKLSNSFHQADSSYIQNQQEYKVQGFSERLKLVNSQIQTGQYNEIPSEENQTFTRIQNPQQQNFSIITNEKVKSNKNYSINLTQRFSKRKLSIPSPSPFQKSVEDIPKTKNYFIILFLVKKFVRSCLQRKNCKDFKQLESKHFKMIGDSSYFIEKNQHYQLYKMKQQLMKDAFHENRQNPLLRSSNLHSQQIEFPLINIFFLKFKKMFIDCKLFSKIFNKQIILPNSIYIILWDFVIILIMLFHLIVIPVKTCFNLDMNDSIYQAILYTVPVICFAIDILIAFNTGIYEFGVVVVEQKLISRAYWKNKFPYHVCIISTIIINFRFPNMLVEFFGIYLKLNQVYLFLKQTQIFFLFSNIFFKFNTFLRLEFSQINFF